MPRCSASHSSCRLAAEEERVLRGALAGFAAPPVFSLVGFPAAGWNHNDGVNILFPGNDVRWLPRDTYMPGWESNNYGVTRWVGEPERGTF